MIKFNTTRFGELEVQDDRVINFSSGLLGFPELQRYVLMDYKDTPLKWLQAVDDPDVAFIVAEPSTVAEDYNAELESTVKGQIGLQHDEDLVVLVILRAEGAKLVANLSGPLVINSRQMKGMQAVMHRT